ncbi:family 3 glycoside hydrolase [Fistulina hepatica ATCC 64428]|uniref:Family 3 glycoside hydrolase n=1 Tax=Fistulina hepatica ATCC 64428 TaxID=1128425 RepID=A0A0D7AB55_9AGAR|nr:family 3 glycoside hydrolase [Fistulina hepatica ATCC 64428]
MSRRALWLLATALWIAPALGAISTYSRAENEDGSLPTYKDPNASIEDRVNDLLPRMTLEEKVAQIIQGDMDGWMNFSSTTDDTKVYNASGLVEMMKYKAGSIWGGYQTPWDKFVYGVTIGQKYLRENTTLGIPALIQSEGLHGFTNDGTTFPSPIGLAASFDRALVQDVASVIGTEAEALGVSNIFAPVLDMSRELRWGRVEENYGEDPFLTGEIGLAYVKGIQSGRRRNTSDMAIARVAANCKHFAAFGSPLGGLNLAPVSGGERELRTVFLKPFYRACLNSLSFMSAYSSYDGIPAIANTHLLTDILRDEWGYQYWVTTDSGSVDLLITEHATCETRTCAAKTAIENYSGEMGGGTYTYLTLPDQVNNGSVDISYIDVTVKTMLRTKLALGLFENPYPYDDYKSMLRTPASLETCHKADTDTIVLLENHNGTLPLSKNIGSIALVGPMVDRVNYGDYVFHIALEHGISPLEGFTQYLANVSSDTIINYAPGCVLNSSDESLIPDAVSAVQESEVAIVMVGTWSLDQSLLWTSAAATTGEHVDLSDLSLVGAQFPLVKAVQAVGKPTIVVFISGKPENADAIVQQFYPGEYGGLAIAEVLFGTVNPSGKLPISFPREVGTTPSYYNYLKGGRPVNPGEILDNGTLVFGHQYVLNSPVPLWSFGRGLSYTTFNYTDLQLSSATISTTDNFNVTVAVHNNGSVDGKEVVQVYMKDVVSSVVTPNKELIGFEKVTIVAGGLTVVTIPVNSSQLAVWTVKNQWVVEPGRFMIMVGTSEETYLTTNLTIVA